ncbi:TPA: VapE domain-containing protein [Salmonella enterica]|uniref:virulence-associated E family protein n=1 Tax=Salmonella sp. SG203 TaxID=2555397 RepID=UPI0020C6037D|nr:virulence-associated E family protein [Salmonella sp. SG203]
MAQINLSYGRELVDNLPMPCTDADFNRTFKRVKKWASAINATKQDTKAQLNAKKARLPYIWHAMKDATKGRNAANAGNRDVLFMDMDGCNAPAWHALRDALACFSCFVYSTPSHLHPTANGEHRWRVCLELSRQVTPEEYKRLGLAVETWLMDCISLLDDYAVKWDHSVYNPDHMVFVPDEKAIFERFTGEPVDVDMLLASAPEINAPERAKVSADPDDLSRIVDLNGISKQTFDDLRAVMWHPAVLADAEPGCNKYSFWAAMGNRLAWFKGTDWEEEARQLWLEWSIAGGDDGKSAEHKWDSDQLTADRTGYQAIFARAKQLGVANPATERQCDSVASVDDFEDLTSTGVAEPLPLPAFERDNRGRIEAEILNAVKAVARPDFIGVDIRFDQFRDEIMLAPAGSGQWRPFTDADYVELRMTMAERGFKPVGRELIRDAVLQVSSEQPFDSAITWLDELEWDGVPRIDTFYHTHFGTADTAYTRAVSLYMWTALAGRVLEPGIKADMVPILVGPQGCGKSSGVEALSPDPMFFTEISFAEKDDDLARKMRGRLLAEIGELRGLNTKELESIKAFVTRTHENWIPKYREFATQFPRRLVFIGTTNEDEFLADKTGNRRWLPVEVSKVDVQAIRRDLLLLWAEARETFTRSGGIQFRDAERLAASVHEKYTIKDAWLETVEKWLDTPDMLTEEIPRTRKFLRASDVLRDAIGLNPSHIGKREEMRISNVLQKCGYKRVQRRVDGKKMRIFEPASQPDPTL